MFSLTRITPVPIKVGEPHVWYLENAKPLLRILAKPFALTPIWPIRLNPDMSTTHAFRALIYTRLGMEQQAEAAARRSVKLRFDQQVLDSNLRKLIQPKAPQQTSQQALS